MKTPNICPRCKSTIPLSHVFAHSLICAKCGWSASAVREYFIEEQSNTAINAMYGITVVFFILFFGMTTLGISNLQMIPLKISQWTGRASYYELKKIISIKTRKSLNNS